MTAVLIPTGSEAEWLAARRKGITASEIAVVMGLAPDSWASPYRLYFEKTGALPGQDDDLSMAVGRHFEDFVADRFAELRPEFYIEGDGRKLYAHPDRPWQMATPDRIISEVVEVNACTCGAGPGSAYGVHERHCGLELGGQIAVLECKTDGGFDGWGDDGSDHIPVHYRCQVLWQMDVLGVETGFVACLFMNRRQLRVYELTLDGDAENDLQIMRSAAELFLARLPDEDWEGDPPDVDWRPATSAALKRLYPPDAPVDVIIPRTLARRYRAACAAYKKAEQRRDLAVNQIRERLAGGHRAVLPDGEPVARRDVYDVKEHVRRASHVDKIVPVKPKEPKP